MDGRHSYPNHNPLVVLHALTSQFIGRRPLQSPGRVGGCHDSLRRSALPLLARFDRSLRRRKRSGIEGETESPCLIVAISVKARRLRPMSGFGGNSPRSDWGPQNRGIRCRAPATSHSAPPSRPRSSSQCSWGLRFIRRWNWNGYAETPPRGQQPRKIERIFQRWRSTRFSRPSRHRSGGDAKPPGRRRASHLLSADCEGAELKL